MKEFLTASLHVAASKETFTDEGDGRLNRGPHKAVSFVVERDRKYRSGMSRRCVRRCLVTVEAGCQEGAQKKEAWKKKRQRRNAEREVRNEIAQNVIEGQRKWRKRFWTSTRWRTAKERLTGAEASFWNGGVYEEAGRTGYESWEKIVGQESSVCSEGATCSVGKACMKIPRKKKR